jgi:hypothetical protein
VSKKSRNSPLEIRQKNSGDAQRIAGETYNEITQYVVAQNPIKQRLDNLCKTEKDDLAVKDENTFLYRFGFFHRFGRIPPQAARKQFVELACMRGWTDRETRLQLNIPGHLIFTRDEVRIEPGNKMLWMGRLYLLLCIVLMLGFVSQILFSDMPTEKMVLKLCVVGSLFGLIILVLNAIIIEPWLLTHKQINSSAETPFPSPPPNPLREDDCNV